ncbi:MAG TPA: hypothetical protein VFH60_03060 [Chloroflexia bacterium]|nr:hypothetical protein [Chloroflexia bacterium]
MSRLKQLGILAAITFLLVIALLSTVLGARAQPAPTAQPTKLVWAQVFDPTVAEYDLQSVFMTGPNDAWAVGGRYGKGGIIVRYEFINGVWRSVSSKPYQAPLNAVVAVGDRELWAVGDVETIIRITTDGRNVVSIEEMGDRIPLPSARPRADLLTIQMLGNGEEGWVGGYWTIASPGAAPYPMLLHYKQGVWEVDNSTLGSGAIHSLHLTQGGGWMVGQNGIWRFEGGNDSMTGAWAQEQKPPACPDTVCYETLTGVRAISADEAWAVGSRSGTCAICVSAPYILHRTGGKWQRVVPDKPVANLNLPPQTASFLSNVYFTDKDSGLAVGHYRDVLNATGPGDIRRPLVFSYRSGAWGNEPLPGASRGELADVSMADATHALAVGSDGLVLSYGYGSQPAPSPTPGLTPQPQPTQYLTAPVPDPQDPGVSYFPLVGHTLRGAFRDYWQGHGGLPQFGYPITEEFREVSPTDGRAYAVQYFERARFEYHPENVPPYNVLLGLLGRTVTAGREHEQPFVPAQPSGAPGTLYFKETGHNMAQEFSSYWREHGGLPVYGYPISEPFPELSRTDGKTYLVQYFERNRLEWHPELPDPYKVSLGLLGVQVVYGRK